METKIQKPLPEGTEKKGGINPPPKTPRPPIKPSGQKPDSKAKNR